MSAQPPREGPADPAPGVDGVAVRTLLVAELPLLVAAIGDAGRGPRLRAALAEAGLARLPSFLGHELPKGARVGFALEGEELKLKDERDDTLLRAPREGLDPGWLDAARRLRGTMTVVLAGRPPDPQLPAGELAVEVDRRARDGDAIGAIVGLVEERPGLPLIF